ncbi:MAG TPA: helix-turn-helix domain-containing protein [Anaerolineales bacterium]|nr:helix-turn-helix domain-containing protein [Anaerolineales bacterium]
MPRSKADLIFHPIRARIIVEVSGRRTTANELAESLPEIPRTTLYRHIKLLTEGGVLAIVEEKQMRGAVERVYALQREATDLTPEELRQMTKDDYEQAFAVFVASLLGDFSRYLDGHATGPVDLAADGLRFGKAQLHLTEAEFQALLSQVYGALESVLGNKPAEDRKRRIVSVSFVPGTSARNHHAKGKRARESP